MARRTRRRYRRRSGRWSSNILEFTNTTVPVGVGEFSSTTTLVTNPVQSNLTTSQIYTVKNVEITAELEAGVSAPNYEGLTYYVMFVPQGMNVGSDYNLQHPEYILAYKFYGSCEMEILDTEMALNMNKLPVRVKTRLSRKLNTGDSIVLFIKGYNQSQITGTLRLTGLVRWWTKSN